MYTDDDLNRAIERNIFSPESVAQFRRLVATQQHTHLVDEENFRLVSSFNDIFVVIASVLLLGALAALGDGLGGWLVAAAAWGLGEFFTRKRRMALPSIVLLFGFSGGIAAGLGQALDVSLNIKDSQDGLLLMLTAMLTCAATALHWWRFHVPITVAVGAAALALTLGSAVLTLMGNNDLMLLTCFGLGLGVFALAMYWDMRDPQRQTNRSDVAFWLHLLAAPMMVHPIFAFAGIGRSAMQIESALLIVGVYVVLAMVSLLIDRRALMVSALIYVMYAINTLMDSVGNVSLNFALTALVIGSMLLMLSAFWHTCRTPLVKHSPLSLQQRLPVLH
jgi:MFS family permease